jgi:hypothetical protein
MADECRIMLSVADIADQVAALNKAAASEARPPRLRSRAALRIVENVTSRTA